MINNTEPFNPLKLPLKGERLIEASAGTGKTFAIVILYIRLLLKLGGSTSFLRPLKVEELLVVTFTEAATFEIRNRIRETIHKFRIACMRNNTNDPLFQLLLNEIKDKQQAIQRLLDAEQQMDKASIFTIHGFCQRILSMDVFFKSSILYNQLFIKNESEIQYQACIDFWRRYCYSLPYDIAEVVYKQWKNPKELLKSIQKYLQGEEPIIKTPPLAEETFISRHKKNISFITRLKQMWCESILDAMIVIDKSGVNRRKFNRGNQTRWIQKINLWVQEKTCNYYLPPELKKFSQRFLEQQTKPNGVVPKHQLFTAIDDLIAKSLSLNDLILFRAIKEIRKIVANEKKHRNVLGFSDLLGYLDEELKKNNGEELATNIRTHFPVVMIDEFQDTDPQQCRIFFRIWHKQQNTALLLIGDPKQAIYSFRGADIFTYIKARNKIKSHYILDTNWRSSLGMVDSINKLFTQIQMSFIFREIPFIPVKSADRNVTLKFELRGKKQPAMSFYLMDGKGFSVKDYKVFMAKQSAAQINEWLYAGMQGEALLWRNGKSHPVKASDIAVLVRNIQEAEIMRNALSRLGIPSTYLSNQDSVFNTLEARELLWLLQAVLFPEQGNILRRALASSMLGLTALDLDCLNYNDFTWDTIVEEFITYRVRWQKHGVIAMLREIMIRRKISENILSTPDGDRRLTNFLHVIELLQKANSQLKNEYALIRWLTKNIISPDNNSDDQQIRMETDNNLIQIITIHKSKGLEYPLVWLPFIADYRTQNQAFYHDRISFKSILDLNKTNESMKFAENERLAEDLRILYVALTRSIWHCSLGLAPLFHRRNKKKGKTDLHHSAIGYLLQKAEAKDAIELRRSLEKLCNNNDYIMLYNADLSIHKCEKKITKPILHNLKAREVCRKIVNDWQVISYSVLHQNKQSMAHDFIPKFNIEKDMKWNQKTEELALTPHQFPRGKSAGRFLHKIFEDLDFSQQISPDWILKMLLDAGYELHWQPMLSKWISTVLKTKLIDNCMSLSAITKKEKQVEMEFYLPIDNLLHANVLDALMRKYDFLSKNCPPIHFHQVTGMLKGTIDLIFRYNNCYYLLDYKSNWLGENSESYTSEAIISAMCSHRYDLQYHLYTLALHRYLRHRITNYCYNTHFGGVIYLFLRGVSKKNPYSGIFTTRPVEKFIEGMDLLFSKNI